MYADEAVSAFILTKVCKDITIGEWSYLGWHCKLYQSFASHLENNIQDKNSNKVGGGDKGQTLLDHLSCISSGEPRVTASVLHFNQLWDRGIQSILLQLTRHESYLPQSIYLYIITKITTQASTSHIPLFDKNLFFIFFLTSLHDHVINFLEH